MKIKENNFVITLKTFYGFEEVLSEELKELNYKDIEILNRAVQIKGKLKTTIKAPHGVDQKTVETMALSEPAVAAAIEGKTVTRIIYIPNKIINIVYG